MTSRERRAKSEEPAQPLTHAEDPLLNLSEVARQVGKSPQTIGRWVQDGLLKAIRLPSGLMAVRKSEINAFLGDSALNTQVE
jgi:predicted site-specific integrase-resolvase